MEHNYKGLTQELRQAVADIKTAILQSQEGLVSKEVLRMKSHEENELDLRGYLQDMWGSYSVNSYWGAERYCRQFEEME